MTHVFYWFGSEKLWEHYWAIFKSFVKMNAIPSNRPYQRHYLDQGPCKLWRVIWKEREKKPAPPLNNWSRDCNAIYWLYLVCDIIQSVQMEKLHLFCSAIWVKLSKCLIFWGARLYLWLMPFIVGENEFMLQFLGFHHDDFNWWCWAL